LRCYCFRELNSVQTLLFSDLILNLKAQKNGKIHLSVFFIFSEVKLNYLVPVKFVPELSEISIVLPDNDIDILPPEEVVPV